jgi:hypothetical protein
LVGNLSYRSNIKLNDKTFASFKCRKHDPGP